jgi:hypothetical protein
VHRERDAVRDRLLCADPATGRRRGGSRTGEFVVIVTGHLSPG